MTPSFLRGLPPWLGPELAISECNGRRPGPLFVSRIAPAPGRQPARADLDPVSGHARLSYRRAAELFTLASGGATLHQLRHSRLTHLAEAGVQLPMLMTKAATPA